jgi:hypothetical protein
MTNRTVISALVASIALIAVACASPEDTEHVAWIKQTIPADHCGVLESADGVNAVRIGSTPTDMGDSGCAPKDIGVKGCRESDTRIEFSVSSDFTFYTENAVLTVRPAEECR